MTASLTLTVVIFICFYSFHAFVFDDSVDITDFRLAPVRSPVVSPSQRGVFERASTDLPILDHTDRPSHIPTTVPTYRPSQFEYPLRTVEYEALYFIYNKTNGPYWIWRNISDKSRMWDFSDPNANPCYDNWQGIECTYSTLVHECTITNLFLSKHNMTGSLPRQIGVFKSLKTLDFSQNNITGTLPEEIGNLSSIRIISLQNNQFTGPLPTSFGNIPHLQTLNLHVNYFNGTLPDSLYTIQELKVLQLEQNQLYGTISSNISQLTNLLELLIQLNAFTGTLPSSLGKLKHLKAIDFSSNYFNGTLPSTIGNLKNLTTLIGGGNYLHGSLPSEIGQLRRLILLDLTVNNFTGQIPESVANLTRIEQFYLNDNQFFGTIPNTFPGINTKDLFSIDLSYNHLTGTIPLTIFHWKKLQFFSIQYNYFHGEFPWNITNFPRLIVFQIGNNQFYGSVPSVNKFDNFTRMVSFNIASNTFTGLSPSGNWSILTEYIVYNNYLSGSINDILSQSNFLNLFEISNNYLTGSIPLWFANKNQLGYVNMTSNFLTGSLDQLFGNKIFFPDLTQLSLSHNDFSGTIPDTIFQISHLHGIFLNDNRLSGTLPGSISQLHELEVLLVQNNLLTGNFPAILSSPSLENVDISNNLLSGTLPINFYSNSSLISLSIGTNCFHGSLPLQLCNMRKVEVFAFNGLSTASQCRLQLFPGSRFFDSFILKYEFNHNIPDCLFTMPNLQTLHLSGNGLTGSLPSNVNISNSLTDLSLSHNQLTGTIPSYIQERKWMNLDLSYNKLGGILSNDFHSYDDESSLSLEINRLSGNIPSVLQSAAQISILEGNLFKCDVSRSDLPKHDDKAEDYSCGSDVADYTLYVWVSVFGIVLLLLVVGFSYYRQEKKWRANSKIRESYDISPFSKSDISLKEAQEADEVAAAQHHGKSFIGFMIRLIIWRRELYSVTASTAAVRPSFSSFFVVFDDANNTSNIKNLTIFLQRVRILSVVLGGIILFVFLPLFSSLGIFYSQYENKYAWKVSGLLLTGVNAALSLEIVLFLLLVFIVAYFQFVFHYRDFDFMRIKSFNFLSSDRIRGSATSATSASTAADSTNSASLGSFPGRLTIITLFLVGLLDCLCMIIVDIVYVYVIITYDTSIIILSEMLLALVKTLLNNVLIWRAVPTIKRFLQKNLLPTSTATSLTLSSSEESFYFTRLDISFITIMILLNNIIFPIFAVFIVSPDCFYTALFQPADVSSSYTYTICDRYAGRFYVNYCYLYQTLTQDSSYNPPFMYNYQCASTIFINYVSVFILMYTVEGIVLPLCKLVIKFINEVDDDEQTQDELYQDHNELSSASQSSYSHNSSHHRQSQSQNQSRITMTKSMHARESVSMAKALQSRISSLLLPANLKSLTPNLRDEGKIGKNYQESILFDKNRLAVRLNSYLVVMLSFGALFPPLALIVCVTIFTVTIYEEIVIGRLLYESERLGYVWYKRQLEKDCSGIEDSLKYTLWSLIPVSSALYAYIIFDTWGDEEGGFNAIIPALCMLFVPTILLIALKKNRFFSSIWKNGFRCPFTSPPAKSNEEKSESEDARNTISSRFTESKEDAVRGSEIEVPSLHTRGSMEVVSNPILIKDKDLEAPPPPLPSPSASPSTKKRVGFSESSK